MKTKRIENLVKAVYDRLQPLLGFDGFYVALYDPTKSIIEFPWVVQGGQPTEWTARPYQAKHWLLDSVIESKVMRLVDRDLAMTLDKSGLQYWLGDKLPLSWLAIPMIVEDRVIGALVTENRYIPQAFTNNEIRVISTAARQTAVAIENARLVAQRNRKIADLSAIYEMGQKLNSEIRSDEQSIIRLIYAQVSKLMDTSNLYIALYDEASDVVSFPVMYVDGQSTEVASRPSGNGRTEWIIRSQQPIFNATRAESAAWYQVLGRQEYIGQTFASWIGVPMIAGDKILGVIATYHKTQDYVYTADDLEILELVAHQAAKAIENKRLYAHLDEMVERRTRQLQKRNEQLAVMHKIGIQITSHLELDKVLTSIVEHANALLSADFSTLFFYHSERNEFGRGLRRGSIAHEPSTPKRDGHSAYLVQSKQAIFIEDTEAASSVNQEFVATKGVKSVAGIPLVIKNAAVGLLYVNYHARHDFSNEERDLIGSLANYAAVAIDNANLYAEMEQQVQERTNKWLKASQKAIAAEQQAAINSVAGELVHRLNNLAGTIPARVKLAKEQLNPEYPRDKSIIKIIDGIQSDTLHLLEAAKHIRESTTSEPINVLDVNDILRIAFGRVRNAFPTDFERIAPQEDYHDSPLYIAAPRNSLLRGFEHLLRNAVEAVPGPGIISVMTKEIIGDGRRSVEIVISDTGVGIKLSDVSKVFDLLYTTKPGGMGFGLWDVKNIVKSIEGEIEAEPLSPGTKFTIRIPIVSEGKHEVHSELQY